MIVLASQSPRRKQLLAQIVKDFIVVPGNINEENIIEDTPIKLSKAISFAKGNKIHQLYVNDIVISADTIVVLDGKKYGKPKDLNDAFNMLKTLSNKTHQVITAYTLFYKDIVIENQVISKVTFNNLNDEQIRKYINEKNPLDKAGSYGAQETDGYKIIKNIQGSKSNVIGFPIEEIKKDLQQLTK